MRVASVTADSIVDGPGLRLTVFTQGCPHHCPGCHNPATHGSHGGTERPLEDLQALLAANSLLDGLTLSGGEPFCQSEECAALAAFAHGLGLNVWTYTGYRYEDLLSANRLDWNALLQETDVLVDGPFVQELRSVDLLFRGSGNQRLIDLPATRAAGTLVLWTRPDPLAHFQKPES